MRLILLLLILLPLAAVAQSDDLTVTLPTGKVITFQTLEQKQKYLLAQKVAKVSANAEFQRQQQERIDAGQRWRDEKLRAAALARIRVNLAATILSFRGSWTVCSLSFAVPKYDWETTPTEWVEGRAIPGTAYVEWNVPKDIVNGDTRRIVAYDCGVFERNGDRYRRFTVSEDRAIEYLINPSAVKWPSVGE